MAQLQKTRQRPAVTTRTAQPKTTTQTRSKQNAAEKSATGAVTERAVESAELQATTSKTVQATSWKQAQPTLSQPISAAISQQVTQKQSLAFAQIFVHSAISTVAFLRGIFSEECFEEQFIPSNDKEWTYEQFATSITKKGARGLFLRALKRGSRPYIDDLLNDLEHGVFDALKKKLLRAFQIELSQDVDNPSHILESYMFTFAYTEEPDGVKRLDGVVMDHPDGGQVTVRDVKKALQLFTRKIIESCKFMPALTENLYLSSSLFHTEDAEPDYRSPGFEPYDEPMIWRPQHEDWVMDDVQFGVLDMGRHAVSLKVSHLQAREIVDPTGDSASCIIPDNLRYNQPSFVTDMIDTTVAEQVAEQRRKFADPTSAPPPVEQIHHLSLAEGTTHVQPHANSYSAPETQGSTQRNEDQAGRRRIQKMLNPSPQSHTLEETQLLGIQSARAKALAFVMEMPKLQLTSAKLRELRRKQKQTTRKAKHKASPHSDLEIVSCECGHNEDEGDMINCEFCGSWQHQACYGYVGSEDPRKPDLHACYECLLSKEQALLQELKNFALLRKGLDIVIDDGHNNDKAFSNQLHCDVQTAAGVANHFKQEGILLPNSIKKKGVKPKFVAVTEEPDHGKMMLKYFDPTSMVAHHFEPTQVATETAATSHWASAQLDVEMADHEANDSDRTGTHDSASDTHHSLTVGRSIRKPKYMDDEESENRGADDGEITYRHSESSIDQYSLQVLARNQSQETLQMADPGGAGRNGITQTMSKKRALTVADKKRVTPSKKFKSIHRHRPTHPSINIAASPAATESEEL